MIQEVKDFLSKNALTQSTLARSIGVSTAAISQYLKDSYKGDVEGLEKKIKDFMNNYKFKDVKAQIEVVETADLRTTHFIIDEAIICKELAVVYGQAGCGKTTAVKEFKKTHPEAILIEAIPGMGMLSVLNEICNALGIQSGGKAELKIKDIAKEFERREAVLIIDEAENLTTKTLEAIRRIWDFSSVPTVLVGTYALLNNLKGRNGDLLQLYSRVSGKWEFKGLNDDDWTTIFGEFAENIKEITTHFRRASNIFNKAKRFAKMKNEPLNIGHIKTASTMVILG